MALEPSNEIALSHCSKAWSDAIFLADIKGKHREALTKDAKEECNRIALAYSEKVSTALLCTYTLIALLLFFR